MARSGADLLALQGDIKRDPDGYSDEFKLQYRHYQASLAIFNLKPSKESREFAELVSFVAQVSQCYSRETEAFAGELIQLLDTHYEVLDSALRRSLVKALILLRNRGQLSAAQLHPLFFRLFRCQDKGLRQLLFRHTVADIKGANQKQRNERLNRAAQNFLYSCIGNEGEAAAKPALAVLTELWRRHVWRDARTANVIASAVFHESPRILLAAVKFFLGQDEAAAEGDSDDEGEGGKEARAANPSRAEIYNASKKGTTSSKKKKMAKLKRVMATVKRQERREKRDTGHNFAAIQLLHDPQSFAERLFSRLQRGGGGERFETRLAVMVLVSRVVGVHRLLLLNFYPFLQKYLQPHQRDVTQLLAALVQACHELVPPDVLAPVLRQLVDSFVHDRARPEVMTLGLKTVRELCARAPLVMTPDLLQDLALYKKFRNKEVASAARGLIGLFRELAPGMLEKRDRGRGADADAAPLSYGAARVHSRVEGAELLQADLARGEAGSDDEERGSDAELDEGDISDDDEGDESAEAAAESDAEEASSGGDDALLGIEEGEGEEEEDEEAGSGEDESEAGSSVQDADSDGEEGEEVAVAGSSGRRGRRQQDEGTKAGRSQKRSADPNSLGGLKRQLEEARAAKRRRAEEGAAAAQGEQQQEQQPEEPGPSAAAQPPEHAATAEEPLEYGRILTEEDFARIRELRRRRMVDAVMRKHGLKSAAKRERLMAAAEDEADEAMAEQDARAVIGEQRVDPASLTGRHKARKDKAERMESVLEGREGREFGSAAARRKKKTGGLSNRQKAKAKNMPAPAKAQSMKRRLEKARKGGGKNFKGRAARTRR